ncbi:MAG: sigma-54 dependent transcriptional regulator [Candidatus Euphemobacter frigidus]|nr:sigma-54 dependent transcriptional regulator [Candidatus Euphemobacter frigidus]MDP8275590.1 sigma-54 dependent transcriptional regulator [Candidatus Euphemobacter frigidus]
MSILLVNHDKAQLGRWCDSLRKWDVPFQHIREGFTALQIVQLKNISGVICRLDLPLISGFALSGMLKNDYPDLPIVLAAPEGSELPPHDTTRKKSWDIGPVLLSRPELQKIVGMLLLADGSLLQEERKTPFFAGPAGFQDIIGLSPVLLELFTLIHKVKDQDITVLIQGESGTGKELVARAIHQQSSRMDKPFVSVNCAAIPETLLESELFGHEKGSFTGADTRVIGRFEQADHGCLFLDEIGDMSPATQAKVLRVFEGRTFERVGGRQQITVDVRIIAATNRDLEENVSRGRFREDLFYRLSAFPLVLPPLRERMEDLPLLTAHILREFNRTASRKITAVTLAASNKLLGYYWPGNIRHLENVVKRAAILTGGGVVDASHIIPERRRPGTRLPAKGSGLEEGTPTNGMAIHSLAEVEKEAIEKTLRQTEMNISQAAKGLGISRATLYKKIREYGIEINRQ